jgi:uncharacterized protein (TIGR00290 family)
VTADRFRDQLVAFAPVKGKWGEAGATNVRLRAPPGRHRPGRAGPGMAQPGAKAVGRRVRRDSDGQHPMADVAPVIVSWSGGKDSALLLRRLRQEPGVRIAGLLTAVSPRYDRIAIHGVRRSILHAQAAALRLPLFEAFLAPESSNADYDKAITGALDLARGEVGPVRHIAFGDLFLEDVKAFREEQGRRLGFEPVFPLWLQDTATLARDFIASGFEAYLTCVDTTQLAADFAGRKFDASLLADLPPTVDPCGERGEFHTCVVAGPVFRSAIPVERGRHVLRDGRFEYCDLLLAPRPGSDAGSPGMDVGRKEE